MQPFNRAPTAGAKPDAPREQESRMNLEGRSSHAPDMFDRDDFADEPVSRPDPSVWPPALNAFGMVGQHALVGALEERIAYAKHRNTRLSDVTLCGLPGAGKSSIARAIARQIAKGQCLALNGADIESPKAFVKAIGDHGLFGEMEDGAYPLEDSIIFIDEIHTLKKRLVAWLLSALDDARTTSHDGRRYSFHRATFILATTDPGKLPETFRSRAETVYLKPYTLDEVAGIICTHGRPALDGATLPYAVCEEIAARVRANPRRAVRSLLQGSFRMRSSACSRAAPNCRRRRTLRRPSRSIWLPRTSTRSVSTSTVSTTAHAPCCTTCRRTVPSPSPGCARPSRSATAMTSSRSTNTWAAWASSR